MIYKLKKINYDAFKEVVEIANIITINNNLSVNAGAVIENMLAQFALHLISGMGKKRND